MKSTIMSKVVQFDTGMLDIPEGDAPANQTYRIRALDRALEIPSIHYLWDISVRAYGRVKGANTVVGRALDTVENVLTAMLEKSLPVTRLMEKPIYTLDKTFCSGLDFVEIKLPLIKEAPKQFLDHTKLVVLDRLGPAIRTLNDLKHETQHFVRLMKACTYHNVHFLRLYSWQQADRVMSTETGIIILKTVDSTTNRAESLLDKYLPAPQEEDYFELDDVCSDHDNLHHTILRLSEFSTRASRRIYLALMEQMQHMYKIEILVLILHALIVIQVLKVMELSLTFFLKSFY